MIVADIEFLLGNQLFAYAATKCLALDAGHEYRYRVIRPDWILKPGTDQLRLRGLQWSSAFESHFAIDASERVGELPDRVDYAWRWQSTVQALFDTGGLGSSSTIHVTGSFIDQRYFAHHAGLVRSWFSFRPALLNECVAELDSMCMRVGATKAVAVHVRCNESWRRLDRSIHPQYFRDAIDLVRSQLGTDRTLVIVFSDDPRRARATLALEDVVFANGDMFHDLCLMSLCNAHVVTNSTFGWWGPWLAGDRCEIAVRPSVWPTDHGGMSACETLFPPDYAVVSARRERMSMGLRLRMSADGAVHTGGRFLAHPRSSLRSAAGTWLRRRT